LVQRSTKATVSAVALLLAVLPAAANGAALEPHVVHPESVTAHPVTSAAVDPAVSSGPAASPASGDSSAPATPGPAGFFAAEVPTGALPPAVDPPTGDRPKPKPKPAPGTCKTTPGHVCPRYCLHGPLGAGCKPPAPREEQAIPEPIQTAEEYMRIIHLCAGAMEVLIYKDFIDLTAQDVPYDQHYAYLQRTGVLDLALEAWNIWSRYNCLTFSQL
jgi:hypothetical protein